MAWIPPSFGGSTTRGCSESDTGTRSHRKANASIGESTALGFYVALHFSLVNETIRRGGLPPHAPPRTVFLRAAKARHPSNDHKLQFKISCGEDLPASPPWFCLRPPRARKRSRKRGTCPNEYRREFSRPSDNLDTSRARPHLLFVSPRMLRQPPNPPLAPPPLRPRPGQTSSQRPLRACLTASQP